MDLLLAYFGGIVTGVLGVVLWAACVASVPVVPGAHGFGKLTTSTEDDSDGPDDGDDDGDWALTPEDEEILLKWGRR